MAQGKSRPRVAECRDGDTLHHWLISNDPDEAGRLPATCRRCGEERSFPTYTAPDYSASDIYGGKGAVRAFGMGRRAFPSEDQDYADD